MLLNREIQNPRAYPNCETFSRKYGMHYLCLALFISEVCEIIPNLISGDLCSHGIFTKY